MRSRDKLPIHWRPSSKSYDLRYCRDTWYTGWSITELCSVTWHPSRPIRSHRLITWYTRQRIRIYEDGVLKPVTGAALSGIKARLNSGLVNLWYYRSIAPFFSSALFSKDWPWQDRERVLNSLKSLPIIPAISPPRFLVSPENARPFFYCLALLVRPPSSRSARL